MMNLKSLQMNYRKQSRWLKISEWLLFAYLLYALLLGLLTPYILQSKVPSVLSESLGRQVAIEKITINPFLLRARISNFRIAEEQVSEDFFRFSLLEVDAGFWQTILTFTPSIEHVYLNGPYTQLIREQGGENTIFNFSDIIEHIQASSKPVESKPEEESDGTFPHIRLGLLKLTDGMLQITDKVTGADLDYPDLAFELAQLDTQATLPVATRAEEEGAPDNLYQIDLTTEEGGTIHVDGLFQLAPLALTGKVALHRIALPPLWPLSDDIIDARLTQGLLDFALHYQLSETAGGMRFQADQGLLKLDALALADAQAERITIKQIAVDDFKLDTDTQRADIASLRIDSPLISGEYHQQGLDLVNMFMPKNEAADSTQSAVQPSSEEPLSWQLVLSEFSLADADIRLHDTAIAQSMFWRIYPFNISTGEIDTSFTSPIDYQLELAVSGNEKTLPQTAQGRMTTKGKADVAKQAVTGEFEIEKLALAQAQAYLTPYVNLSLTEGELATSGQYAVNGAGEILFTGDAAVNNLTVLDGLHHEPLAKWQAMAVNGIRFDSVENQFAIETINFEAPYAKILIDEQKRTNIGAIMRKNESAPDPESTPNPESESVAEQPSPLAITIGAINLANGSAYFADESLTPQFASSIESLNGSLAKLSSDAGTAAEVSIDGKIDSYAPVSLKGEVNPLLDDIYLDLDFAVSGAELTSVNPYSGTYMGYYIDKGLLSLDVRYKVKDNALDGDNHVVIDQLTLGRKSDSDQALSLPLGLAVALLQDSDGVIDLGLEVSGQLDNPDFSFGSIILNALGNLITKAVTAPFTFLASLVGSDDELNHIEFTPGLAVLNDEASARLSTLAEALNKRPGLRVSIEGAVDAVSDARELAIAQLHQGLLQRSGLASLPTDFSASNVPLEGPLAATLESMFTEQFDESVEAERQRISAQLQASNEETLTDEQVTLALHIAMYNRLRDTFDISEEQLATLAQQRAKAVKTYLANQAGVEVGRLFLLNSQQHLQSQASAVELALEAN